MGEIASRWNLASLKLCSNGLSTYKSFQESQTCSFTNRSFKTSLKFHQNHTKLQSFTIWQNIPPNDTLFLRTFYLNSLSSQMHNFFPQYIALFSCILHVSQDEQKKAKKLPTRFLVSAFLFMFFQQMKIFLFAYFMF